jgi:hypothetical protein
MKNVLNKNDRHNFGKCRQAFQFSLALKGGALHLPFPYLQGGSSRGTAEMVRQNNKLHKGLKQQVGLGIRDRHAMQSAAEVAAATYLGAISWAAI